MRIFGHIGWYSDQRGEFEGGRALCGKKVTRKRIRPFVVCGKCVDALLREIDEQDA